jgi:hypothetical protein
MRYLSVLLALPFVVAPVAVRAQDRSVPAVRQAAGDKGVTGVAKHIQRQVAVCLELPPGRDGPLPRMRIALNRDGSLIEPPVNAGEAPSRANNILTLRLAIAIIQCAPFKGMDRFQGTYESWKNLVLQLEAPALRKDGGRLLRGDKIESVEGGTTRNGSLLLGPFMALNSRCAVIGQSRAWLIRAPQDGKVVISVRKGEAAFAPGHAFTHCNDRVLPGTTVIYKPKKDFTGNDSFQFGLRFPDGERRSLVVNVQVR